ncbi:hypothetical protein ACWEMW_00740 [Streptomyces sp. NPDC004684]
MIVLPPATGAVLGREETCTGREETCTGREETCTGREETCIGREETCTGLEETVTADRPDSGTKAGDAMAYSAGLR